MLNNSKVKTTTKRKAVEDEVLQKARKFVQKPKNDETEDQSSTSKLITKKPRHTTEEKLEAKLQKSTNSKDSGSAPSTSAKKKSKNKKRKKKKQLPKEKNPEQEIKRKNEALCYLKLWEKHRDQWKFEKLKQIWLLKNALKPSAIDDKNFEVLLNYVSSIKGHSRTALITDMQNCIENYETNNESTNVQDDEDDDVPVPNSAASEFDKVKYERARKFVQMLSDD